MASSKIDHETGVVTITTPDAFSALGDRFYVLGSAQSYGIRPSDWVLRLLEPLPPWKGQTSGQPNYGLAQERLLELLRSRELHPSLIAGPGEPGAEPLAA
jgi:hypothetical protein